MITRDGVAQTVLPPRLQGLRRGHISVIDRAGLEAHACECYAVVSKELKRLLDQ